jgi:hypothetical protein
MKYTNEVFQRLSRGQFVSSNSIDTDTRAIYNDIEENQSDYEKYFEQIDFILSNGDGYYYFARKEQKVTTENKLKSLTPWIDYLDFLTNYDSTFDSGTQFTLAQIEVRVASDVELRDKLEHILEDKQSIHDKIEALANALVSQGFAEVINEVDGRYQVTTAFRYITNIMECLNIDEEVKDEIPE